MQHLVYSVRYSVVLINFSLLITTLYSSVITTLVYNDKKISSPFHDVITEFDSIKLILQKLIVNVGGQMA
jgi:hypothetical protein